MANKTLESIRTWFKGQSETAKLGIAAVVGFILGALLF